MQPPNQTFRRQYRVRWRDTDASGFVHFSAFVLMMEETEYAFLRSVGVRPVTRDERGVIGFPRVLTEIGIENPARFDDLLDIELRVAGNDGVRLDYRFAIRSGELPVATGTFVAACCRFRAGQPPRAILIPDWFLAAVPRVPLPGADAQGSF